MKSTIDICHHGLKRDGFLVMNIAGVKSYPDLHQDFVGVAMNCGFKLVERVDLLLSKMMGTRSNDDAFKSEPVFVFKKASH